MIRFELQAEPADFDARCRQRGLRWLRANRGYEGRPRDYWSGFEPHLRAAFHGLCGYCAMRVMKAQVDHFIPVAVLKRRGKDALAYEWSNFRYGEGVLNQRKGEHRILDPFEVADDWFEVLLPSLQLVPTAKVPRGKRKLAEFTLEKLGLRDSEVVVRYRREWFRMYQVGKLTLGGLREVAPLVARTVERDLHQGLDWQQVAPPGAAGRDAASSASATRTSTAKRRSSPNRGTSRASQAGPRTCTLDANSIMVSSSNPPVPRARPLERGESGSSPCLMHGDVSQRRRQPRGQEHHWRQPQHPWSRT
jgi:hypothetical protein